MKKASLLAILLAATALTACAGNQHKEARHHNGHGFHKVHGGKMHNKDGLPRAFAKLDLSDAQKQKIRAIIEANRPSEADKKAMKQAYQARKPADFNAPFDEAAARQAISERQARHAETALKHQKMRHEIMQVLTPEQRAKLSEKRPQMKKRGMAMPQEKAAAEVR